MAVLADLGARIGFGFDMARVIPAEALLFLATASALGWMAIRGDAYDVRVRRVDLWLAAGFALAGIRAALWAAGLDVYVANLVLLAIAGAAGARLWYRRRHRRS